MVPSLALYLMTGWFDSYIPENRKKQISAWIDEWAGKISYAAYHGLGNIESEKAVAALGNSGRTMDLDGTYGGFNITRSAFKNYMIEAGKTAVDLGSKYIILDGAAVSLTTLSFDDEIIDQFRTYLYNNFDGQELAEMGVADISSFNYRAYLKTEAGGSYTSSESLNNNPPNDGLWKAWKKILYWSSVNSSKTGRPRFALMRRIRTRLIFTLVRIDT